GDRSRLGRPDGSRWDSDLRCSVLFPCFQSPRRSPTISPRVGDGPLFPDAAYVLDVGAERVRQAVEVLPLDVLLLGRPLHRGEHHEVVEVPLDRRPGHPGELAGEEGEIPGDPASGRPAPTGRRTLASRRRGRGRAALGRLPGRAASGPEWRSCGGDGWVPN